MNTLALVLSSIALAGAVLSSQPWRWRQRRRESRAHRRAVRASLQQRVDNDWPVTRRDMRRYKLRPRAPADLSLLNGEDEALLRGLPSSLLHDPHAFGVELPSGGRLHGSDVARWRQLHAPTESA